MIIKQLVDFDIVNYKKPSMFIGFPNCDFKCERECGKQVCQNSTLATASNITISEDTIIKRYLDNPLTTAFVLGGMEPWDTSFELFRLIYTIRKIYNCNDDIVIYTGYTEKEISQKFKDIYNELQTYPNIIIKFGRFIPDQEPHLDEVLGIKLASDNQYAKYISEV